MQKVIGLTGFAGVGKTTIARLFTHKGYTLTRFAEPLKDMLRALGLSEEELNGSLKDAPCVTILGITPRHAMQTLGMEWGRDLIHPDLWIHIWGLRARKVLDSGGRIIVDDCRFRNEAVAIHNLDGIVINVERPDYCRGLHPSERPLAKDMIDFNLNNNGKPEWAFKALWSWLE